MIVDKLYQNSLDYHRYPSPGKISVVATKPLANQRDLALAYSPGVAAACHEITKDPAAAAVLTARSNLVGVITNGTAVLGLGPIGPLAAKPVMEGKGVLFKRFAGIDVFDIEINESDPDKLIEIIASLEPTFGAINLEDIKAPECFEIEQKLKDRLHIPVFHDDQHGTAIIVAAAIKNGLKIVGKTLDQVKLVTSGAGAAALACVDLLVHLGLNPENIILTDIEGVVYKGRLLEMDERKIKYARQLTARSLTEAIKEADIFLGLSAGGVLTTDMVKSMASQPLIFALANPTPEIDPALVKATRSDAIIATGRSDYPNQVNNVLCFPFIFRGALDVGATTINDEMKLACVDALANLAMAEASDIVTTAYGGESLIFGPDYLIPRPFDPRLIIELSSAVARAAMDTGVATRPLEDLDLYRQKLTEFIFRSGLVMKTFYTGAKTDPKTIVYAEGEDERVLQTVQLVLDEKLARPILVGRRDVVERRIHKLGLRIRLDNNVLLIDPQGDPRYNEYSRTFHDLMERKGVSPDLARTIVRTNTTVIAALTVKLGYADAMLCGVVGRYHPHLNQVLDVIGLRPGIRVSATMNVMILNKGTFFLCDAYVNTDPTAEEIAEITLLAAEQILKFGIQPKIALLSHSNFGSSQASSARKMREALNLILDKAPHLEIEGEMHADTALSEDIRKYIFPNSRLKGQANLLIMPMIDAANIAYNMIKILGDGQTVGPILLGANQPVHILTPSVTVRGILDMTVLAAVNAQVHKEGTTAEEIPIQEEPLSILSQSIRNLTNE